MFDSDFFFYFFILCPTDVYAMLEVATAFVALPTTFDTTLPVMTRTLLYSHFFSFFYLFFFARARQFFIRAAYSLSLSFPSLPSQARLRTLCSCSLSKVSLLAALLSLPCARLLCCVLTRLCTLCSCSLSKLPHTRLSTLNSARCTEAN
jgi:hypothetical protein